MNNFESLVEVDHLLDSDYIQNSKASRTRGFAFLVYEDSAPINWLQILDSFHVMAFVSPLHDKDFEEFYDPDTGNYIITSQIKKPHYHVMLMFDGVKSDKQVLEYVKMCGGANDKFIKLGSISGYSRYLCHLDQPQKYQYSPMSVLNFGGADYFQVINLPRDRYAVSAEIIQWLTEHKIYSYSELCLHFLRENYIWFINLHDSPTFWHTFLKSASWSARVAQINKKDDHSPLLPGPKQD